MSIAVQLLDCNIHIGKRGIIPILAGYSDNPSIHTAKPSLSNQERSTETTSGQFKVGEGEDAQIIGSPLRQEVLEINGIGEVPGVGIKFGPP